jgi:hypothetical protein
MVSESKITSQSVRDLKEKQEAAEKLEVRVMFRTASWLVYGARWFTASGYERSAQGFDARDDHVNYFPTDIASASHVILGRSIAAIDLTSLLARTRALVMRLR